MPLNEITAPFYCIVHYFTDAYPTGHVFRLYLDSIPSYGSSSTLFTSYTDAGHVGGWTLHDIIDEVLSRFYGVTAFAAYTIGDVEMWESEDGLNTFVGLDPDDYSDIAVGAGDGVASAYGMFVVKAADRSQFRLTLFENNDARPQRFPRSNPPLVDDDTLDWFFVRSAVKFVTNDNKPITNVSSMNIGYNRKLARSYGRSVQP